MDTLADRRLALAKNNSLQQGFPWSDLNIDEQKEFLAYAELEILRKEYAANSEKNQILEEAKQALQHFIAVVHSMADRGYYPEELLHDDQRNDGEKLFMGKQGILFATSVVKKINEIQK